MAGVFQVLDSDRGGIAVRPNIVVFLCDQMRRQATSFAGEPNVRTPHIDRCAERGVYFENACSTYPICVPFRFSLMTGEYAHTRMVPGIAWRMSPAERTIAHEMNDAGYETAYFGKWHLHGGGGKVIPGYGPVYANRSPVPRSHQGGFRYWRGFELRNDPYDTYYFADDDPTPRPIEQFQTDGLVSLFQEYVHSDRDKRKPFFSIISVEPPHPPFVAPQENLKRVVGRETVFRTNVPLAEQTEKLRHDTLIYHAMVENLDDNVERIFQMLEEENLLDETIFVFLSDHGELLGSHGLRAKQQPFEESVGIPAIVFSYNPQLVKAGLKVSDPISTEDLFPTLCRLAGIDLKRPLPGFDLSGLIRGEIKKLPREGVMLENVAEFRPTAVFHKQSWRAFRTQRYKYTVLGDVQGGEPWQLFDLHQDPFEMNNLISDPSSAEVARHLHGLLRNRLVATGDHYVLKAAFGFAGLNLWEPDVPPQRPKEKYKAATVIGELMRDAKS